MNDTVELLKRMKEELIKELVANSKFTNRINLQYQQKMELLQKENSQLRAEIDELQRAVAQTVGSTLPAGSKEPSKIEM